MIAATAVPKVWAAGSAVKEIPQKEGETGLSRWGLEQGGQVQVFLRLVLFAGPAGFAGARPLVTIFADARLAFLLHDEEVCKRRPGSLSEGRFIF